MHSLCNENSFLVLGPLMLMDGQFGLSKAIKQTNSDWGRKEPGVFRYLLLRER